MNTPKNVAGSVDPDFGNGGKITFDRPIGLTRLMRDQTLITIGTRLNPDGLAPKSTLLMPPGLPPNASDESYLVEAVKHDAAGQHPKEQVLNVAGATPRFVALAVQADGKYLILWEGQLGTTYMVIITRFHGDGTPDGSFASGGSVPFDLRLGIQEGSRWALNVRESDGAVFAAFETIELDSVIIKLHSNGLRDQAFGNNGVVTTPRIKLNALAFPNNGGVLVGGDRNFRRPILLRFTDEGLPDQGFGQAGAVEVAIPTDFIQLTILSIAVDASNKITVVGSNRIFQHSHNFVAGYTADGQPDLSFNQGLPLEVGSQDGRYVSHVVQRDGKVVVLAWDLVGGVTSILVRYTRDAHKDPSFGDAGVALAFQKEDGPELADVTTLELQEPGEKLVVSGPYPAHYTFITRLLNDA